MNLDWNEVQVLQLWLPQIFRTSPVTRLKQEVVKSGGRKSLCALAFLKRQHQSFLGHIDNRFPTLLVPQRSFEVELFLPLSATLKLCFAHKAPNSCNHYNHKRCERSWCHSAGIPLGDGLRQQISFFSEHKHLSFVFSKTG